MARTKNEPLVQQSLQLSETFSLSDAKAMLKDQIDLCESLIARMKKSMNTLQALGQEAISVEMSTLTQDVYKIYPCFKITV